MSPESRQTSSRDKARSSKSEHGNSSANRGSGSGSGSGDKRRKSRRRRGGSKNKPRSTATEALAAAPVLDTEKSAETPLTDAESAQMVKNFAFLARHRKALRLKLNAQEDLLLNGAKEPRHRGVCMHLLGKVDRSAVAAALARLDDGASKAQLLEGLVRFSTDIAILISYLEALGDSVPREEAAAALALGLERIDFEQASKAQTRRVLDLIVGLFPDSELPSIVFGLLRSQSFRDSFDAAAEGLPDTIASILMPLRVAWRVVVRGKPTEAAMHSDLLEGARLLLAAAPHTLRSHPAPMRLRLCLLAFELPSNKCPKGAVSTLLNSFSVDSREYSKLGTMRARNALRRRDDAAATQVLTKLQTHQPAYRLPGEWLAALAAPRLGRVALSEQGDPKQAQGQVADGMQRGFWLDQQRPVWVRAGIDSDESRRQWQEEYEHHMALALPGVTPILLHGVGDGGIPYVALADVGTPAPAQLKRRRPNWEDVLYMAREGVVIAYAVQQLGYTLPDLQLHRFLLNSSGRMWLTDLGGLDADGSVASDATAGSMTDHARDLAVALLSQDRGEGAGAMCAALRDANTLPDMALALARR